MSDTRKRESRKNRGFEDDFGDGRLRSSGLARVKVQDGILTKPEPAAVPEPLAKKAKDNGNGKEQTPKGVAPKGVKRAPGVPDREQRQAAKVARQVADQETQKLVIQVQSDMANSAEYVAELVLDRATYDPKENFADHQEWINEALADSNAKVRQAAWFEMYRASLGVKMTSHEELNVLLQWLTGQKRLECLGKLPKGKKSQCDIFHFGTEYEFCHKAGLSETQAKVLLAAFATARGKIWRIVNARWKAAPADFKVTLAEEGEPITVQQFIDCEKGDCIMRVPGKWSGGGVHGRRRYMEGGLLLITSTGKECSVWMASNEMRHSDGTKAWGNFEWWFSQNIMAQDDVEAVSIPMQMVLRFKRSFSKNKLQAAKNLACERIRDGVRHELGLDKPKPKQPKAEKPTVVEQPKAKQPKAEKTVKVKTPQKPRTKKTKVLASATAK